MPPIGPTTSTPTQPAPQKPLTPKERAATLPSRRPPNPMFPYSSTFRPIWTLFTPKATCAPIEPSEFSENIPDNTPAIKHSSIPHLLLASSIGGPTEVLSWRLFTGNINAVASTPEHRGKSFFSILDHLWKSGSIYGPRDYVIAQMGVRTLARGIPWSVAEMSERQGDSPLETAIKACAAETALHLTTDAPLTNYANELKKQNPADRKGFLTFLRGTTPGTLLEGFPLVIGRNAIFMIGFFGTSHEIKTAFPEFQEEHPLIAKLGAASVATVASHPIEQPRATYVLREGKPQHNSEGFMATLKREAKAPFQYTWEQAKKDPVGTFGRNLGKRIVVIAPSTAIFSTVFGYVLNELKRN